MSKRGVRRLTARELDEKLRPVYLRIGLRTVGYDCVYSEEEAELVIEAGRRELRKRLEQQK